MGNLVTNLPNYRLYVIHKIPSLRVLDFQKVTKKEREEAKLVFESEQAKATMIAMSAKQKEIDANLKKEEKAKGAKTVSEDSDGIKAQIRDLE